MATDRTIIPAQGSGGDTNVPVATRDDASSLKHQKVIAEYLVGTTPTEVDASHPLPVVQTGTPALPTGAATETTLAAVNSKLGSALPLPTGAATETTLGAVNTKLGGTLAANVSQFNGTAAASGHGTAANALRVELPTDGTGVVGITGTVPLPTGAATAAKQPALGTAGSPASDVITVQGNASGTPIPVSGTFSASGTTDLTASGSLTGNAQNVAITTLNGMSVVNIDVSGTWAMTISVQVRIDGTNWVTINGGRLLTDNISSGGAVNNGGIVANGRYQYPVSGCDGVRVLSSGFSSGTAVVALRASAATGSVELINPLPAGSSIIGVVGIDSSNPGTTNAVDLKTVAGSSVAAGHGVAANALRVELPTDGTGQVKLATGANTIGALTANQTVNQAQVAGTAVDTNSGNKSAGTQRFVLATDQPNLTTPLNVAGAVTNAGTFAVQAATELATGLTPFSNTALTNTKTQVKSSAGKLYGWMIFNPNATAVFLQVWDVALASITVGTTAPTYVLTLPGGSAGVAANVMSERGITHSTAICVAVTTTATGSTAAGTACNVSLFYI